jgi:type IV secretion system protein VirB10
MVNLGNMQASDPQGAAGLKGIVNDHPFAYLKALGLITALSLANAQFNVTAADTQNQYVQNILADSQQMTNRLADKIIDRALDIQPTIVIKTGTKINIVANQTLVLPPLAPYGADQPYHRGE